MTGAGKFSELTVLPSSFITSVKPERNIRNILLGMLNSIPFYVMHVLKVLLFATSTAGYIGNT